MVIEPASADTLRGSRPPNFDGEERLVVVGGTGSTPLRPARRQVLLSSCGPSELLRRLHG
jgi:hypothetical protein